MDFLGPRAIPALIALAALPAAGADCSALDATYRFESAPGKGEEPRYLSDLTLGRDRNKLVKMEKPKVGPSFGGAAGPMDRPKVTQLAVSGAFTYAEAGSSFRFVDAAGATLATLGIDTPKHWSCKEARLVRSSERMSGLGNVIRTEKLDETLERNAAGDLVYRQSVTVIDPPGPKPTSSEVRFPVASGK